MSVLKSLAAARVRVAAFLSVLLAAPLFVAGNMPPAHAAAAAPVAHPGAYHAVGPARLMDRTVAAGGTVNATVTGVAGVPASGVGAVVLNVTVASPTRGGFVTVFPTGTTKPTTSNLNFTTGHTVPNLTIVKVGSGGRVSFYSSAAGSIRLVADISGYYEAGVEATQGGAFQATDPVRVLDTATGLGATSASAGPRGTASVLLDGQHGLPMNNVAAVVLNVTVAHPAAGGYATVYPSGGSRPGTSTLNFPAGRTTPNLTVVKLGADGRVSFYNGSNGSVRFVADLFGYITKGGVVLPGMLTPLDPARVMDTRNAAYPGATNRIVPAHGVVTLNVQSRGGLLPYVTAPVVLNVTVTQTKSGGYITVYGGPDRPGTSNLNFSAGDTVANLTIVNADDPGVVKFYNGSSGTVQLIADVSAYVHPLNATHFRTSSQLDHASYPSAISCASTAMCVAAAGHGRVSEWDGSSWDSPQELFGATDGTAWVSCPTTTFCMAVSKAGKARTFDGSSWGATTTTGVSQANTSGLSCSSASLCLATDTSGKVHRYSGAAWSTTSLATSALSAISCPTATFCMAVTDTQKAFRFNGSVWAAVPASGLGNLDGVLSMSCFPAGTCYAVDTISDGARFDGTSWTTAFASPVGNTATFDCASASYCLETGSGASAYTGSWSGVTAPDTGLVSLDCVSSTFCAGLTSDGYATRFDGSKWSADEGVDPAFGSATDASCTAASLCAVVTSKGAAVTGDGHTWSAPLAVTPRAPLVAVSCVLTDFCLAVGAGTASTFDGSSWSAPVPVDVDALLVDVSCPTKTKCVAVTSDGRAFSWNGTTWSGPATIGTEASAVACVSATACSAVVDRRWIADYDGTAWTSPVQADTVETITGLSCIDVNTCVAVDTGGRAITRTGSVWGAPEQLTPAGNGLSSISCAYWCVVTVAQESDTYTWDREVWSNTDNATAALDHVTCGALELCVAVHGATGYLGDIY